MKKLPWPITIANREKALLQDLDYENGYSLYVEFLFARASVCTAPLVLIRWNGGQNV